MTKPELISGLIIVGMVFGFIAFAGAALGLFIGAAVAVFHILT